MWEDANYNVLFLCTGALPIDKLDLLAIKRQVGEIARFHVVREPSR
jgi:hypothetical protein